MKVWSMKILFTRIIHHSLFIHAAKPTINHSWKYSFFWSFLIDNDIEEKKNLRAAFVPEGCPCHFIANINRNSNILSDLSFYSLPLATASSIVQIKYKHVKWWVITIHVYSLYYSLITSNYFLLTRKSLILAPKRA